MHKIERLMLGMLGTNCYLLWEDDHVLIIDPASKSDKIREHIETKKGTVDGILLTHGHFDHIAGVDAAVQLFHCPVFINELDLPLLQDPHLNLSESQHIIVRSKVTCLPPGRQQIGKFRFDFIDAPGHSEGSSMMLWHDALICGDVLFQGSIGRTDFYTSSNTKMMQTLQMIKGMNPDLHVYPGHGEVTTLHQELLSNPFLS